MNKKDNRNKEFLLREIYEKFFYNSEENKVDEIETKFNKLCERYQMRQPRRILFDEEKAFRCLQIRKNFEDNKPLNVEICLGSKFMFHSCKKIVELEETIIRFCGGDMAEPDYIILGKDSSPDATIFMNDRDAYLAIRDKDGAISYLELVDFYMLAVAKDVVANEEYGLLLEYRWFDDSTCREFNAENDMELIKELFFENWFSNRITRIQKIFIRNADTAMLNFE